MIITLNQKQFYYEVYGWNVALKLVWENIAFSAHEYSYSMNIMTYYSMSHEYYD